MAYQRNKSGKKIVSLIGPSGSACTGEIYGFGKKLGKALVAHHFIITCGGMDGLME